MSISSSPVGIGRSIRCPSSSLSSPLMTRCRAISSPSTSTTVFAAASLTHPMRAHSADAGRRWRGINKSRIVTSVSPPHRPYRLIHRGTPGTARTSTSTTFRTTAGGSSGGGENAAVIYRFGTEEDENNEKEAEEEEVEFNPKNNANANGDDDVSIQMNGKKNGGAPAAVAAATTEDIVDDVLAGIADTDLGQRVTDETREDVDEKISQLEKIGAMQTPCALENPLIFGDYDVSYVSTGKKQIGNPAGGRYRSGLGALLFRTVGLEQNLYEPNVVVNRIAFLVFGLVPGEVVLNGTFMAMTEDLVDKKAALEKPSAAEKEQKGEEKENENEKEGGEEVEGGEEKKDKGYGVDDGMTVRAFFDPPQITVGGLPTVSIGPKSSVVLSTTYLDDRIRLGKGSRGSLFVFTRKTAEQAERDRKRWSVGALAITMLLACTVTLFVFAVKRFRAGGVTELSVATAVAVVVSFAMALVMRQGGIIAEDADYDEKYEAAAARAKASKKSSSSSSTSSSA